MKLAKGDTMNTRDELGDAIGRVAVPMANALAEAFLQKLAASPRRGEFISTVTRAALMIFDGRVAPVAGTATPKVRSAGDTTVATKVVATPRCSNCRAPGHRSNRCPKQSPKGHAREARTAATKTAPAAKTGDDEPPPAARLAIIDGGAVAGKRRCSSFRRARTLNFQKWSRQVRAADAIAAAWDVDEWDLRNLDRKRPRHRSDCIDGPRPCPFVGCRHHTALVADVARDSLKEIFPDLRIVDEPEGPGLDLLEQSVGTCVLDIADRHGNGPEHEFGALLGLRQLAESGALPGQTPGMTMRETGRVLNLSTERTRMLERNALQELRVKFRREG
jgi:Sigma-70, region 4